MILNEELLYKLLEHLSHGNINIPDGHCRQNIWQAQKIGYISKTSDKYFITTNGIEYMNKKQQQKQQQLIDKFNERYNIGDKIKVRQDDGNIVEWTVRNEATMLGGHSAVIWAEEHTGCYSADRVIFE